MIDPGLLSQIQAHLESAPHGAKSAILQTYADMLGCSPATVRRHVRQQHGKAKRCKGRPKSLDETLIDAVWSEKVAGEELGLADREIATRIVLDKLSNLGFPGAAEASVSGVNNALRHRGYRDEARRQRIEHATANEVQLLDLSRSKYFQVYTWSANENDYILRVDGRQLGYKEADRIASGREAAVRSWYVSLIDSYSRCTRARLYAATGEDATLVMLALREFWTSDTLPLHHPPETLWMDRGSAGKTQWFRNALESVGIDLELQTRKETMGKVERQFRTLWGAFEMPLALELGHRATISMGELNARLHAFLAQQAEWSHPTRKLSRAEAYRHSLRRRPPREIDTDLFALAFDAHERVVDQYGCITLDRVSYRVPEQTGGTYIRSGMRLRVCRYRTGELVANLIDQPGAGSFICEADSRVHSHPVGRPLTRRELTARSTDIRLTTAERVSAPPPSNLKIVEDEPNIVAFDQTPTQLVPEGPREEAAQTRAARLSGTALRAYVGRRLRPYALDYASLANVFEPLAQDPDTLQADVDQILAAVIISKVA